MSQPAISSEQQNTPSPTSRNTLAAIQAQLSSDNQHPIRQIPPLEKWHPSLCGDMDMVVKANGEWWHEGSKVTRQSLIDLFAKVLWAEIDDNNQVTYYLKTPVEKLRITVEDAPLLITQVDRVNENGKNWLQFTTSQGDVVRLDDKHPICFGLPFSHVKSDKTMPFDNSEQPYLLVRQNGDSQLYGLIHRNVFYHLIEMGELVEVDNRTILRLKSGDSIFELGIE